MNLGDHNEIEECLDEFCAAILKQAYDDLLNSLLVDAAHRWKNYSYNCNLYYEQLRTSKRQFRIYPDSYKRVKWKDQWNEAKHYANVMMKWFYESERCKSLCKEVSGGWFVEQAKKHVKAFALDEKPEWEIRPTYSLINQPSEIEDAKKRLNEWKIERDKWRDAHGMGKVDE